MSEDVNHKLTLGLPFVRFAYPELLISAKGVPFYAIHIYRLIQGHQIHLFDFLVILPAQTRNSSAVRQ
ncbi:hypothetical protein D3C87_1782090 [compost metagenome]